MALHRLEQDYGESEIRIGTAAEGRNVLVLDGLWHTEMEVTDIALKFADSSSAPQVVSDHLIACAIFASDPGMGDPQKDNVRQIVGPEGERLATSPQAKLVGQATTTPSYWLTAESELFWPSELLGVVMANTGRALTQSHISSIGCS
ncbi:hypothetical protein IMCC26256_11106 [Actinobacteria bacterium IMCC26256]|nr:hypothetical protein IMCC26256_11106 [Actinobacteria bacterium IMCC26256]